MRCFSCLFVIWFCLAVHAEAQADSGPTDETAVSGSASPSSETISPPALLEAPATVGPPFDRLFGEAVLLLTIDEQGKVTQALVHQTSGNSAFDKAAAQQILSYRFTPAMQENTPISVQILFRFNVGPPTTSALDQLNEEEAKPTGSLSGILYLKGRGTPLAGIGVSLKETGVETFSDKMGVFSFDDLPPGEYVLSIEEEGFYTYKDRQTVRADEVTEVKYYIEPEKPDDDVLTVRAKRPQTEVTRRTVRVEEVIKIPGVNGDIVKVVQNLPG